MFFDTPFPNQEQREERAALYEREKSLEIQDSEKEREKKLYRQQVNHFGFTIGGLEIAPPLLLLSHLAGDFDSSRNKYHSFEKMPTSSRNQTPAERLMLPGLFRLHGRCSLCLVYPPARSAPLFFVFKQN